MYRYSAPASPTTYDEMLSFISALVEKYGDAVSFTYLGGTLRQRAIPTLSIGCDEPETTYLYVGAHHASEHITSTLLLSFADDILNSLSKDITEYGVGTKDFLKRRRITVVPMLNCDGVEIEISGAAKDDLMRERLVSMNKSDDFTHWQANGRGVDLNHNYDAGFEEYKKIERRLGITGGAPSKYSGEYPESEPEVGALCNHVRFCDTFSGALTLHTQGEEIYGTGFSGADLMGKKISEATGYSYTVPDSDGASYGGMSDWIGKVMKKPSFTIECGKGENPLPPSDAGKIYKKIRKLLFTFPRIVED